MVLGMSGGVDSTAAAVILSRRGYRVAGVTLTFPHSSVGGGFKTGGNRDERDSAAGICSALGISHVVEDAGNQFRKRIVENFIREYRRGRTPNPCILCNQMIKFPLLAGMADRMDCRFIATGHYSRLAKGKGGRTFLARSGRGKDQSYFLYRVPVKLLNRTLLPLGDLTRGEAEGIVEEEGLSGMVADQSQDACFLSGEVDTFLANCLGYRRGEVVNEHGEVLGSHRGIHFYTVGQRRGIGISASEPLYVKSIHSSGRRVVVAPDEALYSDAVTCTSLRLRIRSPGDGLSAKIRYRHSPAEVRSITRKGGRMKVVFRKPQRAIAPGQSLVLYNGNGVVLGGGIIE